jgi:hypothetical protein
MESTRITREKNTIHAMIRLYCRNHHQPEYGLCAGCQDLLDYAFQRIDRCPYEDWKPTCKNCPIHCYKPDRREEVRKVMRYSGPRLILYHPILTIQHLLDGRKKPPHIKGRG